MRGGTGPATLRPVQSIVPAALCQHLHLLASAMKLMESHGNKTSITPIVQVCINNTLLCGCDGMLIFPSENRKQTVDHVTKVMTDIISIKTIQSCNVKKLTAKDREKKNTFYCGKSKRFKRRRTESQWFNTGHRFYFS